MDTDTTEGSGCIEGGFNYVKRMAEKPATFLYKRTPDAPMRTWQPDRRTMPVCDGRPVAAELTLDRNGFAFLHRASGVQNFYDDGEVRSVYYPECERLVKEVTGAARVVVFDHNVRCGPMAKRGEAGVREPVRFAHNDYTLKSGPQRVRDLMGEEAEALLKNRFAFINVWRPIRGPVEEAALAVCDAQSMEPDDFIATDLKYRDRTGEVYSIAYSPNHRWFYFPRMRNDEVLLLKCYDSSERVGARFTAHCAFDDPTSPQSAAPRESIEVRTITFFAS